MPRADSEPKLTYRPEFGVWTYEDADGQTRIAEPATPGVFAGRKVSSALDNMAMLMAGPDERVGISARMADEAQRMAWANQRSPVTQFVGEAGLMAPTAALGAGTAAGAIALNTGLGALEGALDYMPGTGVGGRAVAGAVASNLGDLGGRMVSRVFNTARGLVQDLRGRTAQAANPAARDFEALGGRTLAYQRMEPNSPGQRKAERFSQWALASENPPGAFQEVLDANDSLVRERAAASVGMPAPANGVLDDDWRGAALDSINAQYVDLRARADGLPAMPVDSAIYRNLMRSEGVRRAIDDGLFAGLVRPDDAPDDWTPTLTGREYMDAREYLAQEQANLWERDAKGAERLGNYIDAFDQQAEAALGDPQFTADYGRTREQYRNYLLLEKPNVINSEGQINVGTLHRALVAPSGYGRKASAAQAGIKNPETAALVDLTLAANKPTFKPFKSSGTAENMAVGSAMGDAATAAGEAATGNVLPALGLMAKARAPGVIAASNMGNGAMFQGMNTPSPAWARSQGAFVGRSFMDEMLYPFVGAEDDRGY